GDGAVLQTADGPAAPYRLIGVTATKSGNQRESVAGIIWEVLSPGRTVTVHFWPIRAWYTQSQGKLLLVQLHNAFPGFEGALGSTCNLGCAGAFWLSHGTAGTKAA